MQAKALRWHDYDLGDSLHAGAETQVVRANARDGRQVVLKLAPATLARQARTRHEADVLASLREVDGVSRLVGLVHKDDAFGIVLDDAGPWSLKQVLHQRGALPLDVALSLAHQLARALDGVHRAGVVHKDVKPQNIVVDRALATATLIDFGLASRLAFEATSALVPEALEGTLAYISPEQTGRTARSLDARTDLYSLGVTLFEMLAGRRPFIEQDALALVYAHLAVTPPSLEQLVPGIPPVVARLVERLLAKTQEVRYQTANGLASDLDAIRRLLREGASIDAFTLGDKDFSPTLLLPEVLVGREAEAAQLTTAFRRAAEGSVEMVLVGGPSGIGKTALVRSVYREMAERRGGQLITGKHDQLGRTTPYAALTQAFSGVMSEIAASPREIFEAWRARLADALGANAGVIASSIPELAWVLGEIAPVAEVPLEMAYNRLKLSWIDFVRAVSDASPPLVLFLDDMQWVDAASVELLNVLLTDVDRKQLLVISAYRDNEVDAAHPLWSLVGAVEKSGVAIGRITVGPLTDERVEEWLAVALSSPRPRVAPLARALRRKTDGNPFFLGQLLLDLANQKHVRRDVATGSWEWDQAAVEHTAVTDNVVDLMRGKVAELPPDTQELLGQAACAGHVFTLSELAMLSGQAPAQATQALWPALVAGLVVPNDGQYRDANVLARLVGEGALDARYHFLHDRVQQAFHERIAPELRAATHLHIGRRLLRAYERDGGADQKFLELVRHLAAGAAAMESDVERRELARLELLGARAAKRGGSYRLAASVADAGIDRLGPTAWAEAPQLVCDLALERLEAAYMLREFDEVHRRGEALLAREIRPLARVMVQQLRVRAALAAGKYADGLRLGLEALEEQGIRYPETHEGRMAVAIDNLTWLDAWLAAHPVGFSTMPLDASVEHDLRDSIISTLAICGAIRGEEALAGAVITGGTRQAVEAGRLTVSAPFFGTGLAALRASILGEYRGALRWAREAHRAAERVASPFLAECCAIAAAYSMHEAPAETAREGLRRALSVALASGSFQGVSWAQALELNYLDLWSGRPLAEIAAKESAGRALMTRVGDAFGRHVFELTASYAELLMSAAPLPGAGAWELSHGSAYFTAEQDGTTAEFARIIETHVFLIAGDHARALARADEAERNKHMIHANPPLTDIAVWRGVAAARSAGEGGGGAHRQLLAECVARVRSYADGCWENFGHKLRLLEAEAARLDGQAEVAMAAYEDAIVQASAEGFLHVEAMAAQLCGEFHLDAGRRLSAAQYLTRAIDAYTRWGARRAVSHLRARHGDLLAAAIPLRVRGATSPATPGAEVSTFFSGTTLFDVDTALRSAQALATEHSPERVVARLMELVAKNAGAPRAALLLGAVDELSLEAQLDVTRAEPVRTGLGGPLAACPEISAAMVELAARSRQPLVLADARRDRRFASDPRVVGSDVRSVLVVPLGHQGRQMGVLYLEHPEPGAFTGERVTLVGVLASQAAVALENARLYAAQAAHAEKLEQDVAARTRELRLALGRLQRELAGAAAYVKALLPPPIPDGAGPVAVDWRFVPCSELGGDAFDYLWLDDEHFSFYMFDVCGHGVGPAVQSLSVLRTFRARQLGDVDLTDPAAVCTAANAAFGADFGGERYFTMWYGVYEPRHRRLTYTSAGHPPAVLIQPPGSRVVELTTEGAPVALVPEAVFANAVTLVEPGSRLYVLTDGVYEVQQADGSLLPYDSVRAELASGSSLPRAEAIERILRLAREARGGRPLADDFSLLAIDFR